MNLHDKNVLITGGARRIGRHLALAIAKAGGNVIIHYGQSKAEAKDLQKIIQRMGRKSHAIQADLSQLEKVKEIIIEAEIFGDIYALINNASIFKNITWDTCTLDEWNNHLAINLTTPFLLCQEYAHRLSPEKTGKIINILDWRALRPGNNHLPYTISKAGLAALTKSLAISLAPNITVNGLALGAILPPSNGGNTNNIINTIPAKRWASLKEVEQAILFLLTGPSYITGEIIHLDGGRHLV